MVVGRRFAVRTGLVVLVGSRPDRMAAGNHSGMTSAVMAVPAADSNTVVARSCHTLSNYRAAGTGP